MFKSNIRLNANSSEHNGGGYQKQGMSTGAKVLIVVAIIAVIGIVVMSTIVASIKEFGTMFDKQFSAGMSSDTELIEKTLISAEQKDAKKIAVVSIDKAISGDGSHIVGSDFAYLKSRELRKATKDSLVTGLLLYVNSPGGGLGASDLLHHEVLKFKESGRPVVVFIGNMCASGGYYISAPADVIISSPTALVGSIGVIMQLFNGQKLMEKIGLRDQVFKSAEMKDAGSPFRDMSQREREYFQYITDHYFEKFLTIVEDGRNMPREELLKIADGRVFPAEQALEFKLIDQIGFFDDALAEIRSRANSSNAALVKYEEKKDIFSSLKLPLGTGGSKAKPENWSNIIKSTLDELMTPEVRLIWQGVVPN